MRSRTRIGTLRRSDLGFTLVELATVLGIIAVLAGITITGLGAMKKRGTLAGASGDFVTALRRMRAEAFSRGQNTVFVVDTDGNQYWGLLDTGGDFDITKFDKTNPTVPTSGTSGADVLLVSGVFPTTVVGGTKKGVYFGPADGFGSALPSPFNAFAGWNSKCNFCTAANLGAIVFQQSGGATFTNSITDGAQVSIEGDIGTSGVGHESITLLVNGRTGAVETFSRSYH